MHMNFIEERRALLTSKKEAEEKIDEYFMCCKKNIALLECIRKNNFQLVKSGLITRHRRNREYQKFIGELDLTAISKKIDYERACRRGIYSRYNLF